jgi:transcriptional regulator with XRE-family HTH domain
MRSHPLRNEAIELRKQGLSYKEISDRLGISKGTLSYMLKNIKLTEIQKARLRALSISKEGNVSLEQRKEWGTKGGKATWRNHPDQLLDNLKRGHSKPRITIRTKFSEYFPNLKTERTGRYRLIVVPGHPMANRRGRLLEHRYVMAQHLGRNLLPSELVHHKDENPLNNHIDNLQLMSSVAQHRLAHYPIAWVTIMCAHCGKNFRRARRFIRSENTFCSHRCSVAYCKVRNSNRPLLHGKESTYTNRGCRCEKCRMAHTAAARERKHQTEE